MEKSSLEAARIDQLIGAEREEGDGGPGMDLTSPIDGTSLGFVSQASAGQVERAVAAAAEAGCEWARRSPVERSEVLLAVAAALTARREQIARVITLEQGKPLEGEAVYEVDDLVATARQAAGDAVRLESPVLPSPDPNKRVLTFRAALGVVAVISPWNYPTLPGLQALPAIAVGNAVVAKPSEMTPWTAQLIGEAMLEAGLPPGIFNLVNGGAETGAALVESDRVAAVYFVGSSATAERVVRSAGMKRSLIEASGNGPVIVCADADIGRAAEALTMGSLANAGQICTATGRVLVERSVHDELLRAVVEQARQWTLGDPLEEGTGVGPMTHLPTAERVREQLDEARGVGADVAFEAGANGVEGEHYVAPTVLGNVPAEARVHHEETFGPVIPLVPFDDDEDAVRLAAMSRMGLQGAVFTKDIRRAFALTETLRLGGTVVNDGTLGALVPIPYGGAAGSCSGWGRIGGRFELEDLTDLRVMAIDVS